MRAARDQGRERSRQPCSSVLTAAQCPDSCERLSPMCDVRPDAGWPRAGTATGREEQEGAARAQSPQPSPPGVCSSDRAARRSALLVTHPAGWLQFIHTCIRHASSTTVSQASTAGVVTVKPRRQCAPRARQSATPSPRARRVRSRASAGPQASPHPRPPRATALALSNRRFSPAARGP